VGSIYGMSVGKRQKQDAPHANLKVILLEIKDGIFFLKLGHERIWSIKFVGSIFIFRQKLAQNLSKIEKTKKHIRKLKICIH
jgi:wobble nucleotide-excising tRNase